MARPRTESRKPSLAGLHGGAQTCDCADDNFSTTSASSRCHHPYLAGRVAGRRAYREVGPRADAPELAHSDRSAAPPLHLAWLLGARRARVAEQRYRQDAPRREEDRPAEAAEHLRGGLRRSPRSFYQHFVPASPHFCCVLLMECAHTCSESVSMISILNIMAGCAPASTTALACSDSLHSP